MASHVLLTSRGLHGAGRVHPPSSFIYLKSSCSVSDLPAVLLTALQQTEPQPADWFVLRNWLPRFWRLPRARARRASGQAGHPKSASFHPRVRAEAWGPGEASRPEAREKPARGCLLLRKGSALWSAWASADWTRPTPGRGLCFTQCAGLHVNLNQKHLPGHTQNNLGKYLGTAWASQVDT